MPRCSAFQFRRCTTTQTSFISDRLPLLASHNISADWHQYLVAVYGELPPLPVNLQAFTWFWHKMLPLKVDPAVLAPNCSAQPGHAWAGPPGCGSYYPESQPAMLSSGFFVQAFDPHRPQEYRYRRGFPNHTWVEVVRVAYRRSITGNVTERAAYWLWHASGSGIWYDTGRTLVDASGRGGDWWVRHSKSLRRAAKDFDSIQVPLTVRSTAWPMPNNRFEILDLRPRPATSIADSAQHACHAGGNGAFRSGAVHGQPCDCDDSSAMLNCGRG